MWGFFFLLYRTETGIHTVWTARTSNGSMPLLKNELINIFIHWLLITSHNNIAVIYLYIKTIHVCFKMEQLQQWIIIKSSLLELIIKTPNIQYVDSCANILLDWVNGGSGLMGGGCHRSSQSVIDQSGGPQRAARVSVRAVQPHHQGETESYEGPGDALDTCRHTPALLLCPHC